ncbi:MAG TPA: MFS transporter [Terracidiphilus sp.]
MSVETLSRQFWIFFTAALFFDFAIGLFFFLFNLYLLNLHFNERSIGIIAGALTLGNVVGTVPVGILVRRFGLQKMFLLCFVGAPLISIFRTAFLTMPMQIALAFLTGVALSSWPVCFAPTIAKLTTEKNRVFAFSISFATGIGTGTLAGLVGGSLPGLLKSAHRSASMGDGMRIVLICASLLAMVGVWPILRLKLGTPEKSERKGLQAFHPYLLRFLPAFAIWSFVTGSFIPFAPIFFQKHVGMSLQHVGMIFSASQLAQVFAVLIAPLLYRRAGSVAGIICAQLIAGVAIFSLCFGQSVHFILVAYLLFTAAQFSASPGFYGLLMSRLPDSDRSSASAVQNITGALVQAGSAALTGSLIVRFGYSTIFWTNALLAFASAIICFLLLSSFKSLSANRALETGRSGPFGETAQ